MGTRFQLVVKCNGKQKWEKEKKTKRGEVYYWSINKKSRKTKCWKTGGDGKDE